MSEQDHKYKFGTDKDFADAWERFEKRRKKKDQKGRRKNGGGKKDERIEKTAEQD